MSTTFGFTGNKMPVLFMGHGNPLNAYETNQYTLAWQELGKSLPRPKAILSISAHWFSNGLFVTAMEKPATIHDYFEYFPREVLEKYKVFDYKYPAAGSPELAQLVKEMVSTVPVQLEQSRGFDHANWMILTHLFPKADIPVIQLSVDRTLSPAAHYQLAKELSPLRNQGVLIIGSGNIVQNFADAVPADIAYDWAVEADETLKQLILNNEHEALVNYSELGAAVRRAIPTNNSHYLPLLHVLALQEKQEQVRFFNEHVTNRSVSMRSLVIE